MTRNGRAYRQRLWVPAISETGGGALPTPRTCSAMAAPVNSRGNLKGDRFPNLETLIGRMLPTPLATDGNKSTRTHQGAQRELERGRNKDLEMFAALLTPCASDWKGRTNWEAAERHGPQRLPDCLPTGAAIYLNPSFVEEMMGFPAGWTA